MFQRFVSLCVTDVAKAALLTKIVFMFSVCFSDLSDSCVTDVSKVGVLTKVEFMFSVCFSVLSDSVLPMCQKLPY